MDDLQLLRRYQAEGLCCAQAIVAMGLYLRRETNDQLVQAVSGLCGGVNKGYCCGALTGAACMLGLFDKELARTEMVPALAEWFEDEYGSVYDGVNCDDILERDRENRALRCPMLVEYTYIAARDILKSFGFDI